MSTRIAIHFQKTTVLYKKSRCYASLCHNCKASVRWSTRELKSHLRKCKHFKTLSLGLAADQPSRAHFSVRTDQNTFRSEQGVNLSEEPVSSSSCNRQRQFFSRFFFLGLCFNFNRLMFNLPLATVR